MSKLTSECQAKTIQCCSQCAVSENEINKMIELVKNACIEAVKNEPNQTHGSRAHAIKAIQEVE